MASVDLCLCRCRSGMRQVRCCGLDLSQLPGANADRPLRPAIERALAAWRQGSDDVAEQLCLETLELLPHQPELLWMLSRVRDAAGEDAAAIVLLGRLVALDPNHLAATQDLALRQLRRGALAEAELHARNAVRIAPGDAQSHNLLGMTLTEAHQPFTGEFHYRRALDLTGRRDPILLANLAWSLKLQSRMAEARALYEESAAAAPNVFQTLFGWARLEEADGDVAMATARLDQAVALAPRHPGAMLLRAMLQRRTGDTEAALATLAGIEGDRGEAGLAPDELLEKGRLLDRAERPAEAFRAFETGNARARALGAVYPAAEVEALAGRLRRFFTEPRLATLPRAGTRTDVAQPVFVLGFPRSGTTLIEQVLTAHPMIAAGDELPFIAEIVALAPKALASPLAYPEALSELWMGDRRHGLDTLRDHYLQRVRQHGVGRDAAWFTDKMPLNEFHLGLIALLFPAAPLVHVLRHPLDVVLSAFSNQLTHGLNCATALDSAARHYALTAELIAHYRAVMPLRYLPVRYETFVAQQERETCRMLDFLGVPFDTNCLAPHRNRRYARTASYAQVTEPVHDHSIGRWRRYRTELEPVVPILRPAMDRLGYAVD